MKEVEQQRTTLPTVIITVPLIVETVGVNHADDSSMVNTKGLVFLRDITRYVKKSIVFSFSKLSTH